MDAHRLAEERSLAFHREVAALLEREPARLAVARGRVRQWIEDGSVHASYARAWEDLLDGPWDALRATLLDRGERARALRQVTPFAGFLDPRARWRIWREVRERMDRAS